MLQIQIDGKRLSVEQGTTVMEAAHQIGTFIPHFCYHKKLSIAANCRMCLVEVEKAPKPQPACATPVTDGMVVHTHSPKAIQAQQGVMEFLLINHPLDCPICDQGGECQLQDLAVGYGKSSSRYTEEKRAVVAKDMGPLVSAAEMSRCIHCTRCVRFTEEIAGEQEIAMAHRGEFSEIMPFIDKAVETELSGNIIDLCPVGALTSKPFRFNARSWELSRRKSISAHDALGANLIVQTKDHTVRRVLPLENESINECWISDRDRFAYEGLYHDSRLKNPKIKYGGEWYNVDWSTALEYVRKTLASVRETEGNDAVGIWANPMNTVEELYLGNKIAQGLGINSIDSRLQQQDFRLSNHLHGVQWLGQKIETLIKCHVLLVVGANLRKEQPLLTARLRAATKVGMALSIMASNQEALHMSLHAQEVLHPQNWVRRLNELAQNKQEPIHASLQQAEQAAIILGAEVLSHPDYATIYAAAQQLAAQTGATLGILPQAANSVGAALIGVEPQHNGQHLQEMIVHPKKAVLLFNVEPEIDVFNGAQAVAALRQAQTVMAFTPYCSDTLLEVCDVLLPITPFSETSGSFVNMEGRLQSFHGVVEAYQDARPLWKVLRVLGNMFHLDGFEFNSSEEVLREAVSKGVTAERLNNQASWQGEITQMPLELMRVGGIGIYHTDAIVRRSAPLQATSHAQVPYARVHPQTLATLNLIDTNQAIARQGGESMPVHIIADASLPENVVYLPLHTENAALGALMNPIELMRG